MHYRSDPSPWRRRDLAVCGALALLGVAGIIGCWFGATDEVVWRDQTGWLIGSIFCTGLVVLGGGLWVLIGLRRVRHGFRDLRRDQRTALGLTRSRATAVETDAAPTGELVTTGQMTRAHRPDCLLLRGKQAVPVPAAERANYGRCGVCNS
ncbi:hypothetical protein [Sporichthya sp.]|uniref:hypothetical protein n=1 Tax=Sporichthya sp. TaxID=65475 RepID=UPI0017B28B79|nr:hypothetical protein [Sporichthya sp.]MBA3744182.1 hypothetical protein [Sporichthya sp.]